ncbi:MAG: N-6 DNA methylase [Caldilineaceae bacterium]|nr:N-6 DNA methylase [Caldilineaceae bacterium]
MLDAETKRRIDTARDILVGKVPDPKSQVEQITFALIYKFMDDIDAISEELGGERDYFTGEFARYGWARLMQPGLGGHEMFNTYDEAIRRMPENGGLPPLFRDIFSNAYLPYRDPETLRAFLKVIDGFTYDHSERLGDAFEYLLSVMDSQGDAGQFRTPRHIIDFIVSIVDPKKDDVILDPACGTAGFLISSYKHILAANTDADGNSTLTPAERERLARNLIGYDISPDMVRLSLVNMYLHGLVDPYIYEYDTLTSEERWNEFADVILANPPFMSPKGGIRPHNRFSVKSKRSEVLFVDYMAEHLNAGGRAGIIVPEGIIFQSQNAHKQLRKALVEESLVAVVSLPAGVFNPYSGVKTSILLLDKALARRTDRIAFFKVENDGFDLGSQRRPIGENDLPQVQAEVTAYLQRLGDGEASDEFRTASAVLAAMSRAENGSRPTKGLIVDKERVAGDAEYILSGDRYREVGIAKSSFPLVQVGILYRKKVESIDPRLNPDETFELWSIPSFERGVPELLKGAEIGSQKKLVQPGDVLLSRIVPHIRRAWVVRNNGGVYRQIASTEWIVFSSTSVIPEYLKRIVVSDFFHEPLMQTITGVGGSLSRANQKRAAEILIPLPPLELQEEIVAEIEGYQKVIDGARAVVESYRPRIHVDPEWPMVEIGDLCVSGRGRVISKRDIENNPGPYPVYSSQTSNDGIFGLLGTYDFDGEYVTWTTDGANAGTVFHRTGKFNCTNVCGTLERRSDASKDINMRYLAQVLGQVAKSYVVQVGNPKLMNKEVVRIPIPVPSLSAQVSIVDDLQAERALVETNRELMKRFEKKIQDCIARVWGN